MRHDDNVQGTRGECRYVPSMKSVELSNKRNFPDSITRCMYGIDLRECIGNTMRHVFGQKWIKPCMWIRCPVSIRDEIVLRDQPLATIVYDTTHERLLPRQTLRGLLCPRVKFSADIQKEVGILYHCQVGHGRLIVMRLHTKRRDNPHRRITPCDHLGEIPDRIGGRNDKNTLGPREAWRTVLKQEHRTHHKDHEGHAKENSQISHGNIIPRDARAAPPSFLPCLNGLGDRSK